MQSESFISSLGPEQWSEALSQRIQELSGYLEELKGQQVRWAKAGEIVTTWFLTIPGSALLGITTYYLVKFVFGLEA